MSDDEQPPFRWNPQAVFMLFFFMAAMAIPLMGVVWFARGYLSAQQRPAAETKAAADTSALEKGLERMSLDKLREATVIQPAAGGMELRVAREDMDARAARIGEIAKAAGGTAVDLGTGADGSARRLMVQVSAPRVELLQRAIRGDRVDFSAIPPGADTQMFEIALKAP